ncbi:GNAT family N-acetyltransferase [Veronia nyctiphanis]|uniref:GNAT family N-acetyltransferase n=1 Tax=Veronia nyctiphanis TaxID=1278244 RepID=A0A4Q0YUH2_9GAMM|nr:GNAT family N-acetyltransferase [Veronia nyctiphanis]RXJ74937.1 GNAT family N-acetyltransferase [Veronia nyctiphanis]
MKIQSIKQDRAILLLPIFIEMEKYYFGACDVTDEEMLAYIEESVLSDHSSIKISAIFDDNSLLGFASYAILYPGPKQGGQMYIKDLFISESARGKGLGLEMMRHLAGIAVQHRCSRLDWTAESTNPTAGQFYQSIGAELVTEKEYYRFSDKDLEALANGCN